MHIYVIPQGTKVALGNGDSNLKVFITTKEFNFSDFVCDPIYFHNQSVVYKNHLEVACLLADPIIKYKNKTVAKYSLASLDDGIDYGYKYVYVNFNDVITY